MKVLALRSAEFCAEFCEDAREIPHPLEAGFGITPERINLSGHEGIQRKIPADAFVIGCLKPTKP